MYFEKDNLIFGFHGRDKSLCNKLVNDDLQLNYSEKPYYYIDKYLNFMESANLQKLKAVYD